MKTIALCFNTPGMSRFEWRKDFYGKKYPGAGWMKWLMRPIDLESHWVVDGHNCLKNGYDPKDIVVVQEENNEYGQELVRRGADPRVLMCLESPIFASKFYDSLSTPINGGSTGVSRAGDDSAQFKHRLLFDGGTEHVHFPSFDDDDIKEPVTWDDRRFLCMVTSNKHHSMLPKTDSPSFKKAIETQLHDYRYEAIKHFKYNVKDFDLYGRGWGSFAGECDDKLNTICNYKFALCFENGSYPGYITEKIIDCLVAGVIPVYRGAPDIEAFIPPDIYLQYGSDFKEMEEGLRSIEKDQALNMIRRGQEWLISGDGRKYNNRVFAKRILELCE